METWDAIRSRRNVRSYGEQAIALQDLDQILEAGRRAPSAGDKRTVTEIDAAEVAPSLKWAIASPEKAIRDRSTTRAAERSQFDEPPPF